jgi:hypothetical protein
MKTLSSLIIAAASVACALPALAQDYSAFFRYEEGPRIDYTKDNPEGKQQSDTITNKAMLHIRIPEGSDKAFFSLTYGGDGKGRPDDNWEGLVIHRGDHMVGILCNHSVGGDGQVEKISNYAIYPELGAGFSLTYSARMGMPDLAGLSGQDKTWPLGSASVLRLKQYKE